MNLKVRKSKVDAIRQMTKNMTPLTDNEMEFVEEHITKGGTILIRNPDTDERKIIRQLDKKGIQVITIHKKIISNE
jgi:MinD-like ATPase involved in chromosome partitioning or flagellar assembly